MKPWISGVVFFIICGLAAAMLTGVPNLQSPRNQIFTSGQPDEDGFRLIAKSGVRTVINVLPERQCINGESDLVVTNKMTYRSVPFELTEFRRTTIDHFASVLKASEKPVLIHCGTGNHVGGLWFAYRVLNEKAALAVALEEGRIIGMKPSLEETLLPWVRGQAKIRETAKTR